MVEKGLIKAPGFFSDPMARLAYCQCQWIGDGMGSLDPLKEANAAEKRVQMGQSSLQDEVQAYSGKDWRTVHQQRMEEQAARVASGLEPAQQNQTGMAVEPADLEDELLDAEDGNDDDAAAG